MNRSTRRVMVAVAGMAVLGMTPTLAGAQTRPATYTLDDVMQAPFASDMVAAPTGAAVAWVFNAKGCSNIWVADPSHGVYAGIHDWSTLLSSVGDPIDGRDANRQAVEASPIATIDQWHAPVLLVQADNDGVVPSQQAAELIEDLRSHTSTMTQS